MYRYKWNSGLNNQFHGERFVLLRLGILRSLFSPFYRWHFNGICVSDVISRGVSEGEPACFADKFKVMFCYSVQWCDYSFEQGRFRRVCGVVSCFRGLSYFCILPVDEVNITVYNNTVIHSVCRIVIETLRKKFKTWFTFLGHYSSSLFSFVVLIRTKHV
jgi:hypothetical protein